MYNKVNETHVDTLRQIVGADNVLVDGEAMDDYSHDETVGLLARPEVVVRVTSTQQVSDVFKLAQEARIPVTPRGGGYGLSGGAVPVQGGILLSLEKMNRILEIDRENLMITVEPGVSIEFGTNLQGTARTREAVRTGIEHRAHVAETGRHIALETMGVDTCHLWRHICTNTHHATA